MHIGRVWILAKTGNLSIPSALGKDNRANRRVRARLGSLAKLTTIGSGHAQYRLGHFQSCGVGDDVAREAIGQLPSCCRRDFLYHRNEFGSARHLRIHLMPPARSAAQSLRVAANQDPLLSRKNPSRRCLTGSARWSFSCGAQLQNLRVGLPRAHLPRGPLPRPSRGACVN